MIRWILDRKWLSISLIAMTVFAIGSGAELLSENYVGIGISSLIAAGILASRKWVWLSIALVPMTALAISFYAAQPLILASLLAIVSLLIGVFGVGIQKRFNLISSLITSTVVAYLVGFHTNILERTFQLDYVTDTQRSVIFIGFWFTLTALFLLAVTVGRVSYLQVEHVGSDLDTAVRKIRDDRLQLEVAKQNERLEIAKDLSELLVQRITAMISVTEGGRYAVRADHTAIERVLDKSLESGRAAQAELRRLYDFLNDSSISTTTRFKLADLGDLVVAYRELGFNVVLSEQGHSFQLNDGIELAIYKIVFESMENARKHAPIGSDISIDFLWVNDGLQVLIKDNGVEFANRQRANIGEVVEGYSIKEDLASLTANFDGATISALRARAAIYNGRIEAALVPGVGFTVSAIFPNLKRFE